MGLIKAVSGAVAGTFSDQWKEYFYCDAIPDHTLLIRGKKRTSSRSSNRGSDNIISNGSVIAIADGQCMMIVEQGKVVDLCAEPGEFLYDLSTEPSILFGKLSKSIPAVLKSIGKRFTFGGEAPKDQRVYYVNTKEIIGNKYGTPSPIPFRVVDTAAGLDVDISIRCFGEYSYRITNPVLFYTNVCGNISDDYDRSRIDSQLKSELLTALQPAFARISEMGIRYSALPAHTSEISDALNSALSQKWLNLRGIEVASFGVNSVKASEEDEQMIKELQRNKAYSNPEMAAAAIVGAQVRAMQDAANNKSGAAAGFFGMNMAQNAGGVSAQSLFEMGRKNAPAVPVRPAAAGWVCSKCGASGNQGKFCTECGAKNEAPSGWTCPTCGALNKGKFCEECGTKRPAGALKYRCDKCGWEPEDPTKPPKFCPECGDTFGTEDIV